MVILKRENANQIGFNDDCKVRIFLRHAEELMRPHGTMNVDMHRNLGFVTPGKHRQLSQRGSVRQAIVLTAK